MKLQTQIPLQSQNNNQIDYHSKIVLLGSCFAESIGGKLEYFKFQNTINPFGILFHPMAIENCINYNINKKKFSEEDIFFYNEQWHCFDVHSKLSNTSSKDLINDLNEINQQTSKQLNNASHIIITLGTSWIYRLIENNTIVANCHKVPQNQFKKELLSIEAISNSLQRITKKIHSVNAKATIIFTVSPVRHLKDGFIENTLSKANLIAAMHQVVDEGERLFYFPSYEVMMDELRDYRFYKADMIHPNETAINYIWRKFQEVWIASASGETMNTVDAVQKGLIHKSFNAEAKAYQLFLQQIAEKQNTLQSHFPHIIF